MVMEYSNPEMGLTAVDHSVEESQSSPNLNDFVPRSYQVKVFEVAKRKNTITVLETGAGKTMIAVMLIKHIAEEIKSTGCRKLIIFLAPTVQLVTQQCKVIKDSTTLEVEEIYGAKGVDDWNLTCWKTEVDNHDVLVMTPQILLDALRNAFLSLEMFGLIIFDECHHATGNHPYAKVMKEFYHKSEKRPKIFGMTASPVITKGVSSAMDSEHQISTLESILDSQVYTVQDRTEIEECLPSAVLSYRFYNKASLSLDLKAKMEALYSKYASMLELQGQVPSQYQDIDDKLKMLRKRLFNEYTKILYCLNDFGLICAYEAVKICLENSPEVKEECQLYRESSLQCKYFLDEVLCIIDEFLRPGMHPANELATDFEFDYEKAHKMGHISPKLYELFQIFQSFGSGSKVMCLIFVDRIITAKVIERYAKKVQGLSHFTVAHLSGSTGSVDALAPKLQKETLEAFCSEKVNLLFTTDVVEEGIHVPNCSCVIRFDLPKTVRSWIQSRGRGRKNESQFIVMLERDNKEHMDQVYNIIKSEHSMKDASRNRYPDVCNIQACTFQETKSYYVKATGASVTTDSSVSLIHRYCEKLPGDRYFVPKPIFDFTISEGLLYQCKITLPPNAAFQATVGPMSSSSHLSKRLVCFEACKMLHEMGALDDHLLPLIEEPLENDLIVPRKESSAGAGTTKRKELHGSTCIRALCGTWGDKLDGQNFEAYKFDFSCSIIHEIYSGFVLLVESKLDDDVGNTDMDLQLISRTVKSSVSSCGKMYLSAEQVKQAKRFQEFFFNGLFGILFSGSESEGTKRELSLETNQLWSPSYTYLLLPIEKLDTSSTDSWTVNWTGISSCANVVEFLKKHYSTGPEHVNADRGNLSLATTGSSMKECEAENLIHFANSSIGADNLQDMSVMAIHTGRIYSVVEVVSSKSAESPFEEKVDAASSDYSSYAEYFKTTYGIVLVYPGQPLLRLKQSHNPHNLLGVEDASSQDGLADDKKPELHVHMPPEILVSIDFRVDVLRSFYLLPSLMHRLESLMLASQLREEINGQSTNFQISSSLILEAITTLRCCEKFSLERLELLGDSVLKYVVSSNLFLKYPEKHEGQLSARRTRTICNSNLHKLGTERKIQGYIRDSAFKPRRWAAPGQHSRFPAPCKCGVDTLEVPLESRFQTAKTVTVSVFCDRGHRWMNSKTIADCVEALIGAYYIGGGLPAAIHVMKWLGIDSELEPSLATEAITRASMRRYNPKNDEIATLELKLGYEFSVKGLLLEAITHATQQKLGASYCYQRLEFLGDSVLDTLITQHLYHSHTTINPGQLTDLRSAAVSNENFAQTAVRRNLHPHLQHCSGLLLNHITKYEKLINEALNDTSLLEDAKGPKALGDMVESIAGAILIDSKLDLDKVWRVFQPLLSPIVNPSTLQLHPLRKLQELCSSLGYFVKKAYTKEDSIVHAELSLQLPDVLLVGKGCELNKKAAKQIAARQLLKELQVVQVQTERSREKSYVRCDSKRRKLNPNPGDDSSSEGMDNDTCSQLADDDSSEPSLHRKEKINQAQPYAEPTADPTPAKDYSNKVSSLSIATPGLPVIPSIDKRKGEPRKALYELCRKLQWPIPKYTTEHKSGALFEFGEGSEKITGRNSFASAISLQIPGCGTIVCNGYPKADKKSSFDSAVVAMLYELQRQGKLTIGCS